MSGTIGAEAFAVAKLAPALLWNALHSTANAELGALDYLQRLNLAGLDAKGQVSSAYAQSGIGLSLGANVDFGYLFIPFLTLSPANLTVGPTYTARAFLVLQRLPSTTWSEEIVDFKEPRLSRTGNKLKLSSRMNRLGNVDWRTTKTIALAFLRGTTFEVKAGFELKTALGVGGIANFDETGATITPLKGALQYEKGFLSRLGDPQPRLYNRYTDGSQLNADLLDLFREQLKRKTAAWLMEMGGQLTELIAQGQPCIPPADRSKIADEVLNVGRILVGVADSGVSYVDLSPSTLLLAPSLVARAIVELLKAKRFDPNNLDAKDLLKSLGDVKAQLETLKEQESEIAVPLQCERRIKEADALIAQLAWYYKSADTDDDIAPVAGVKINPIKVTPLPAPEFPPGFYLDISSSDWSGQISTGFKFAFFPKRTRIILGAKAGAEAHQRQIPFTYQSYATGIGNKRLTCTQQTIINYSSFELSGDAKIPFVDLKSWKKIFWNTMAYQSANVNYLSDNNAKPNGSGVSFGISVLAENIASYVSAIKSSPRGQVSLTDDLQRIEAAILKQLRVTQEELQRFAMDAPDYLGSVAGGDYDKNNPEAPLPKLDSYILESAFGFTESVFLGPAVWAASTHTADLSKLNEVSTLFKITQPIQKAADRGNKVRLQVIRLRYRVRSESDDKDRDWLGISPTAYPWSSSSGDSSQLPFDPTLSTDPQNPSFAGQRFPGQGSSPVQLSNLGISFPIGLERVQRAELEGVVEIYYKLFLDLFPVEKFWNRKERVESANLKDIAEVLVPPVALFNQ